MAHERILVVDDDREVVRLLKAYLEKANYQVLVAIDCETALHTLRREKPDLILLDVMMPEMDGYEALPLIKEENPLIKVVVVSADIQEHAKAKVIELGAQLHVQKPINPAKMKEILEVL